MSDNVFGNVYRYGSGTQGDVYGNVFEFAGVSAQIGRIAFDVDTAPLIQFGVDVQPLVAMQVDARPLLGMDSDS